MLSMTNMPISCAKPHIMQKCPTSVYPALVSAASDLHSAKVSQSWSRHLGVYYCSNLPKGK